MVGGGGGEKVVGFAVVTVAAGWVVGAWGCVRAWVVRGGIGMDFFVRWGGEIGGGFEDCGVGG